MHEIFEQVMHYARAIWRYRWYVHLIAWPIAIAGWLFVASLPDQFESSARVYVDTKSVLRPLLRGLAVQSDVEDEVQIMTRTLLSRPNLEKIARMTDMDLKVKDEADMELLIERLKKTIKFQGGRDNIYSISYVDDEPHLAKNVVQSLLTLFVESSLGDSRKDSSSAQRFLEEQIKEYEKRLFDAEERVKEFKQKNVAFLPGRGGDYFTQMQSKSAELSRSRAELEEISRRRDEFKRQMAGEEPTFGIAPSTNIFSGGLSHPLDARISDMEKRRDDLLLKYTDKHPDVVALEETVKRLKSQRDKELEEAKADLPEGTKIAPLAQNPVYQQLKISFAQAEAEVVTLAARVERLQKEVVQLEKAVDTTPQIEAEMQRLNRDYDITKRNYDQLLARRESAKLAQSADQSADDVQFKVLDPPKTPLEAAGPNRLLFNIVVLTGGLAGGLIFAFFLSQVKPTFDSSRRLTLATGLPVFGVVSKVRTEKEIRTRLVEVSSFVLMAALLVVALGIVVLMQAKLRGLFAASGLGI
ncbi:MAG: chain-length determining protein [Gammaproteobacteria bacterium]|nr:chain-length determining protein [Gammaproteobacteria bacterium]